MQEPLPLATLHEAILDSCRGRADVCVFGAHALSRYTRAPRMTQDVDLMAEDPGACAVREVKEELALDVALGPILDSWLYDIHGQVEVLIVTYGCLCTALGEIVISHEHKAVGLFGLDEINGLDMPEGYRRSIRAWAAIRGG